MRTIQEQEDEEKKIATKKIEKFIRGSDSTAMSLRANGLSSAAFDIVGCVCLWGVRIHIKY